MYTVMKVEISVYRKHTPRHTGSQMVLKVFVITVDLLGINNTLLAVQLYILDGDAHYSVGCW